MQSQNEKLVLKRKMTATSIVAVTFVFLLMINIGSYFFIKRIGRHLENGLNDRLKMAASFSSQIIEKGATNFYDPLYQSLLRITLGRIHTENDLEAVYLVDSFLNVIVDSRYDLQLPSRAYVHQDSSAIQQSLAGTISTSTLHSFEGNHFKNVYAPLYDNDGNSALLVLEANADFLQAMNYFKKGLFLGSFISAILLLIITLYLILATKSILKTENELNQSKRLASMGQMSATMAHEIRNPLGIIKSTSDVLRERYEKPDEPDELFSFINEETMRLNRLVNDFLSLSREPKLETGIYDIAGILKGAIDKVRPENKYIEIVFNNAGPLNVECDKDLMDQVILNLLLNSIQAIDEKKGRIEISMSKDKMRTRTFSHIEIKDNGPGFDDSPTAVFEPFYTTKTSGTGLGLAVSRTIVEKHGGLIKAENDKNGGAIVRLYLPMKQ
jgi:signal transduction histidine kinase